MIIWRGAGILVLGIVFGCALVANLLCNHLWGPAYWESHSWPLAAALLTAAPLIWGLGRALEKRSERVLIDPETGGEVRFHNAHDLFFIPMKYWASILVVVAVVVLLTHSAPGPSKARATERGPARTSR